MSIETLAKVLPPPKTPVDAFGGTWEPIEAVFGRTLPPDYKDFARLYGDGYFMEFLSVAIPQSRHPEMRLENWAPSTCGSVWTEDHPPHLFWPNPGGLLPFGSTDSGDYLLWLARGAPNEWPVVVWDRAFQTMESFECDMTDFLAGLVTGDILPTQFPELRYCDHLFQPHPA
jgi:hypothetical protein